MLWTLLTLAVLIGGTVDARAQEFIPLWSAGRMPNSRAMQLEDRITNERIQQVGVPGVYAFFPSADENTGAAVVICPGGGYAHLSYAISGTQLAKWFNSMGVAAFVLKYRLPGSPDVRERHLAPLQDAQRAMRLVRARSRAWGIKTDRLGVLGTSAGGHLAAILSTSTRDEARAGDDLDAMPFVPDFTILISPVITMGDLGHAGSRNRLLGEHPTPDLVERYSAHRQVTGSTPPAFLVHAFDDTAVDVRNSVMYYTALVEHRVPASLHAFRSGGHDIALRNNPRSTDEWPRLCELWLLEMGFVRRENR